MNVEFLVFWMESLLACVFGSFVAIAMIAVYEGSLEDSSVPWPFVFCFWPLVVC